MKSNDIISMYFFSPGQVLKKKIIFMLAKILLFYNFSQYPGLYTPVKCGYLYYR